MTPFELVAWTAAPLTFGFFALVIVSDKRLQRQRQREKEQQQADAQRAPPQTPAPEEPTITVTAILIEPDRSRRP